MTPCLATDSFRHILGGARLRAIEDEKRAVFIATASIGRRE
jgi:hypothetical protein